MPSSLIWIALIAGWVLVLFPMVSGSRKPVSRTGAATEETRVLHRGGKARPVRRGPAAGHLSDPEWQPSPEEEQARRFVPSSNDPKTAPAEVQMDSAATDSDDTVVAAPDAPVPAEVVAEAPEVFDAVVVGEEAEAQAEADAPVEVVVEDPVEVVAETPMETPTEVMEVVAEEVVAEEAVTEELPEDLVDEPVEEIFEHVAEEVTVGEVDESVGEIAGDDEIRAGGSGEEPVRRAGRGGFDPEADAAARAIRYRNRQRTMLGLAGLTGVSILASIIFTSLLVWGAVGFGLLLGAYLYYLRRQVRMEQQIRERRMARLQRSRRDAVAVSRAAHTVPGEARRYGAVVLECDDEDPAFEHLPHYESAFHSHETRAAG